MDKYNRELIIHVPQLEKVPESRLESAQVRLRLLNVIM
jgi:hypothetical protein